MSDFKQQIAGVTHSENASGGLYILLIGMSLGNLLPSISDGIFFRVERNLRQKYKNGFYTPKQFYVRNTAAYYLIPFTYWAALAILIVQIKGDYHKKLKISVAAISAGIVAGIILKMVQDDELQLEKEDQEKLLLLKNHPEVVAILNKPEYENISGQLTFKNYTAIRAQEAKDKSANQS